MYSVKYKKVNSVFWKKIKNVKGDGFIENGFIAGPDGRAIGTTKNIRWFILNDETRIEIPSEDVVFKFSAERFIHIKQQMERETGRSL